jgi:hypothetical protein
MKKLACLAAVVAAAVMFPTAALAAFNGVVVGTSPGLLARRGEVGCHPHRAHAHARARRRARARERERCAELAVRQAA